MLVLAAFLPPKSAVFAVKFERHTENSKIRSKMVLFKKNSYFLKNRCFYQVKSRRTFFSEFFPLFKTWNMVNSVQCPTAKRV